SKWFQKMLLHIDVAEPHAAHAHALNPNDELTAAGFQHQQVPFANRPRPNQDFVCAHVYRTDRQFLDCLLDGWLNDHWTYRSRLSRWRRRVLDHWRKRFVWAPNSVSKRIG